jgi:GGDEF domain-containing protein
MSDHDFDTPAGVRVRVAAGIRATPRRDLAEAELLATKIHAAVPIDLQAGDILPHPGISVGIALAEEGQTVDDMLDYADVALYTAKRAGRNRVATYGSGAVLPPQ